MTPLERDALPGALLDPLIARLKPLQGWFSTVSPGDMNAIIGALEKCREALLMEAGASDLGFQIDPPTHSVRVLHDDAGGARPATPTECALWDAMQTRGN